MMGSITAIGRHISHCFMPVFMAIFLLSTPLFAQQKSDIRSYIFGNSLINHLTEEEETTVPFWLYQLAQKADMRYEVEGQWGFLRDFATELPPLANWSFQDIQKYWDPEQKPFSQANFNTILINPTNFIQYRPPNAPYDDGDSDNVSPLSATLTVFDWVDAAQPDMDYFVYEGWADMGDFIRNFPPEKVKLRPYHKHILGPSHDWYELYIKQLKTARPKLNITLIPVAPILSKLLTQTPLSEIAIHDLYTDNAPHGTATLYFLASLITYKSLYGQNAPLDYKVPVTVHTQVRENYAKIIDFIDRHSTVPTAKPVATTQSSKAPSLAMGLSGISDWSTQQPFVDVMKTAREWIGHLPGQWGGWDAEQLEKGGYLDANGWPKSIPDEITQIETFILTNQPKDSISVTGKYRLKYTGEGTIRISGQAQNVTYKKGEIWFTYTPDEDPVGIIIQKTDPHKTGDYIRDISVVKQSNIALFEVGATFNPQWIERIKDLRSVRFMDWMFTNGSTQSKWATRPKTSDYTYTRNGVPIEKMVLLANEIGADPWFNMPHLATDNYIRNFAAYVKHNLDPNLKTYVEYSNEIWNFTFPQTTWALQQAEIRWGSQSKSEGWMQFSGMRAANMARIWGAVYGAAHADKLTRVIATHTDWPGLEIPLLQAPLWLAEDDANNLPPVSYFDAYAVSGYFGHSFGSDDKAPQILQWIKQSQEIATNAATDLGLSGAAHNTYIATHKYDHAVKLAVKDLSKGSIDELLNITLPYQAKVAADNDLKLIMYEGGTHVVGLADWVDNSELTAFFTHLNYTDEMASLYSELLQGWRRIGGTLFNAFVDVASASKWGSWGALRHVDDSNPRWDSLLDFNLNTPAWWSDRPETSFANGVYINGTNLNETLTGTAQEDTLLAGDGDDVLVSAGGSDYLHGGNGFDRAVLSGSLKEYTFHKQGNIIIAIGPKGSSRLFSIETVSFEDQPETLHPVSGL